MNRTFSILFAVFVALFLLVFWRISANETALEESINHFTVKGNRGQVSEVSISLLNGSTTFSKLSIPIDSLSSVKASRLDVFIGRMNMLRLALFNPVSVFQSGEALRAVLENPVYVSTDVNYPFAEYITLSSAGDITDAVRSYISNKPMNQDWKIQAEFIGVSAWKDQSNSKDRSLAVPVFDRVDVSVSYQNGLKVLSSEISAISSTENQALVQAQFFYDGKSSIKQPIKSNLTIDYNGSFPAKFPIPGLEKSTLSSTYAKINGTIETKGLLVSQSDIRFYTRGLSWTPPSKWPQSLTPAYFIFGANPKPVSIDSLRFNLKLTDKLLQLDDFRFFGSIMQISSDIYAPALPNSNHYLFEAASAEVYFKTPESAQLAQMLIKYSGNQLLHIKNNRLRIRLRGTSDKPAFTSY
ncbi:hypothetical protein EP331_14830 [bacterium]|nr:MAG: hypothetical protein EP331_14830 [bacterium]